MGEVINLPEILAEKKRGNDLCILCGEETSVPSEVDVQERLYFPGLYIEGCGQICEKCEKSLTPSYLGNPA